jgi:hypothetical protein
MAAIKILIITTVSVIQTQKYQSSYQGLSPPSYEDRSQSGPVLGLFLVRQTGP